MTKNFARAAGLLAATCALLAGPALAQAPAAADFPNKPVRLVVTYPPGGTVDAVARMLVPRLSARLGQPVVVDNRGGAGGAIGGELVAKSAADGYTVMLDASNHAQNPAPAQQDALRHAARLRAGLAAGQGAQHPRRASRRADRERQGPDRAGQGRAGRGQLRLVGQRLVAAPGGRALRLDGEDAHDARRLQGRRPGAHRRHGRPGAGGVGRAWARACRYIQGGKLRPLAVAARRARPCCPRCRPSPSRACRATTPPAGSAWWRRPTRPRPWSRASMPRSNAALDGANR